MIEIMQHNSVLKKELLDLLDVREDGIYVDATYGRGGHCGIVLEKISEFGKVIAFDRDVEAVAHAISEFGHDKRFTINHAKFSSLSNLLPEYRSKINGIYFDLVCRRHNLIMLRGVLVFVIQVFLICEWINPQMSYPLLIG